MAKDIPVPDTVDWTWVLTQPCPQCGVDVRSSTIAEIIAGARGYVAQFRDALETTPDAHVRPELEVWSLLEYAAHLRDVCEVFRSRIRAMLLRDSPSYPDWDEKAAAEGYAELRPTDVADELGTVAEDLLRDVVALTPEELQRSGVRSDGYVFTIETLLQYYYHELAHHWWDVSGRRRDSSEH